MTNFTKEQLELVEKMANIPVRKGEFWRENLAEDTFSVVLEHPEVVAEVCGKCRGHGGRMRNFHDQIIGECEVCKGHGVVARKGGA